MRRLEVKIVAMAVRYKASMIIFYILRARDEKDETGRGDKNANRLGVNIYRYGYAV